ncbi:MULTISPECIES: hypothetical protein [Burkholderiaceae]|uniref:hypothetical protein n=1 Tax=Burkholderiaceae TaxID=119060 RepID=UPI00147D6FEA|nr:MULTISPECIES: hypothetical protein [Burkholderiaceae]MCF2134537.1 hypothetical protein [Mycetohabitans sp. B3]MCG1040572.1 hypothetical protein [Mycetohabitans sp. B7]
MSAGVSHAAHTARAAVSDVASSLFLHRTIAGIVYRDQVDPSGDCQSRVLAAPPW